MYNITLILIVLTLAFNHYQLHLSPNHIILIIIITSVFLFRNKIFGNIEHMQPVVTLYLENEFELPYMYDIPIPYDDPLLYNSYDVQDNMLENNKDKSIVNNSNIKDNTQSVNK